MEINDTGTPSGTALPGQYLKVLWKLAIPVMLEFLGQLFLGTVDTYFAGQIGDNAISAIHLTSTFMTVFAAAFNALGLGIMVMISRALGRGDPVQANRVLRQAIYLGVGIGLGFGLINLFFRAPLLWMVGAQGEIFEIGMTYYLVVCAPCVFMCMILILSNGLKAAQNTKASMRAAVTANVVNAVLDGIFIHMGLGVLGLGIATTLSRVLNCALLLRLYLRPVTPLKLDRANWGLDRELMGELLRYSGPILLTQFISRFAILLHSSMVLRLGDLFYSAQSVGSTIVEYACIPTSGFEAAAATLVSNSMGADKPKDAIRYALYAFVSDALFMTVLGIIVLIFARPLAGIFSETAAIQDLVAQILSMMACFYWTSALSHTMTSAVQGTGDSRYPLYVTIIGNLVMRLGGGYLLAYGLGLQLAGIWWGIILDFFFRGVLLAIRFFHHFRKSI